MNSVTNEKSKNTKTIKGETVKSLEEVIIANFLYLHGVKYNYEKKYPHTYTREDSLYSMNYHPDFYLDDYNIYIEHFGINRQFRTPWLTSIEEKKYLDGIYWKRNMHRKHGTTLLETYSYYNSEGTLLEHLDELLKNEGIKYNDVKYEKIYEMLVSHRRDKYFEEFKKLLQSFIRLFKSRGYSESDFNKLENIAKKEGNAFMRQRTLLFLSIVRPLYIRYQEVLKEIESIDFNDMINLATDIVKQRHYTLNYKYIIVDEYQDISMSRFRLIQAIQEQTNAIIMAVGDDWQSIYRFAGSDIYLFTDFQKHLGYSEIMKIEKTYRNSQELVDMASEFVMKNPKQYKKKLSSDKNHENPIRVFRFRRSIGEAIERAVKEIVQDFGKKGEILFLGRTNYDIDILKGNDSFIVKETRDGTAVSYKPYPDVKLSFLTVHKAKGTESDNVIIINLYNELLGFPNKISDDPVLSLVLTDTDNFDFAEERRLFYVALTRTKNRTYLIIPDINSSEFASELIKSNSLESIMASNETPISSNPVCPVCQRGVLVLRGNRRNSNEFLGCSNYPQCRASFSDTSLLSEQRVCNKCGGYMLLKGDIFDSYYKCSNYPICDNLITADGRKIQNRRKPTKKHN
jgi:DNA helicase-4